jgi:repressor LexA
VGIGKRIKEAREKAGLTQKQLGNLIGVTGSSITNYELETSHPKELILYKLIDALHIDANYLFQDVIKNDLGRLTAYEYNHIEKYRACDDHGRGNVDMLLDREYKRCLDGSDVKALPAYDYETAGTIAEAPAIIYLPYPELPASAGTGIYLGDNGAAMLAVPDTPLTRKATMAVRISGDSMEPDYSNGDRVLLQSTPDVEIGDLGIFVVNSEGFFNKKGDGYLISLNPDYDDIELGAGDTMKTVGKVLGKL